MEKTRKRGRQFRARSRGIEGQEFNTYNGKSTTSTHCRTKESDSIFSRTRFGDSQLDRGVPGIAASFPPEEPAKEVLDEALLMSRVDNDPQLLKDLVDLFLEECPHLLDEITVALGKRDAKAVERGAHSLKGSTSNLAARLAWEAALKLERLAQAADWEHAESGLKDLKCQLERLRPALCAVQAETEKRVL